MWLLILIKVRIAERIIKIMKKLSEKMGRRLLLLSDGKSHCESGRKGCIQCGKIICKHCWKKGHDKHEGMPKK